MTRTLKQAVTQSYSGNLNLSWTVQMNSHKASGSALYDSDYYAWVQAQVDALRQHRIEDVDWENVAEEIDDLGKSQKHSIESQMVRVLEHLLKLQHAGGTIRKNNARGWQLSVKDARLVLRKLLDQNPSLPAAHGDARVRLPEGPPRGAAQSEAI